jgi:hypothetical protein
MCEGSGRHGGRRGEGGAVDVAVDVGEGGGRRGGGVPPLTKLRDRVGSLNKDLRLTGQLAGWLQVSRL